MWTLEHHLLTEQLSGPTLTSVTTLQPTTRCLSLRATTTQDKMTSTTQAAQQVQC